jgi:hypothetical protein
VASLSPMTTDDGRDFRAVHASEDVRFDEPDADGAMPADMAGHGMAGHEMAADTAKAGDAKPAAGARRVLYYRNPMGLPDTSVTPKKDSMGMDYIPVYEGEVTVPGTRTGWATTRRSAISVRTPVRWTLPGVTVTTFLGDAEEGLDGDGLYSRLRGRGRGRQRRDGHARQGPAHRRCGRGRPS